MATKYDSIGTSTAPPTIIHDLQPIRTKVSTTVPSRGITLLCMLISTAAGMLLPTQSGFNLAVSSQLDNYPLRASFFSFLIGFGFLILIPLYSYRSSISRLKYLFIQLNKNKIEYFLFFNGFLGAFYITAVIYLSPHIGLALYYICLIAGQVFFSILADLGCHVKLMRCFGVTHLGHSGDTHYPNTMFEMSFIIGLGIGILIAGIIIFQITGLLGGNAHETSTSTDDWYYKMLYCIIAIFAGMLSVIKSIFNRRLYHYLDSPIIAASLNFGSAFIWLLVACIIEWFVTQDIVYINVDNDMWYTWLAGLLGAIYVTVVTVIMPSYIGYVGTFICAILGNLIISTFYDAYGLFGIPKEIITWNRIVGIILVFIAVGLVNLHKIIKFANEQKNYAEISRYEIGVETEDEEELRKLLEGQKEDNNNQLNGDNDDNDQEENNLVII